MYNKHKIHKRRSGPEEKTPFEFIIKMEKINSGNNLIKLKKSEIFSKFSSLFKINKKVEKIKIFKNGAKFSMKSKLIIFKTDKIIGKPYGYEG